ncbi:MAG: adenylosuccinate lyase, partial [Elusimicrobiales bacterium]
MDNIFNISPIDGRYASKTQKLKPLFSESALINLRIQVECEYFIFLTDFLFKKHKINKRLSKSQKEFLRSIYKKIEENAKYVKKIETEGDGI